MQIYRKFQFFLIFILIGNGLYVYIIIFVFRYQVSVVEEMFDTITSIQPKGSGGGGELREEKVMSMALDMLNKMPLVFDMFKVKDRLVI